MSQYLEMVGDVGAPLYIVGGLILLLCGWWVLRVVKGKTVESSVIARSKKIQRVAGDNDDKPKESILGTGAVKCACFRRINGEPAIDFTTIPYPIGEMHSFDPSCPISGTGCTVVENEKGEIVDFDPREVEYKVDESPEYAWFATNWDILKRVLFATTKWWKSPSVWFAAAILVMIFITVLGLMG